MSVLYQIAIGFLALAVIVYVGDHVVRWRSKKLAERRAEKLRRFQEVRTAPTEFFGLKVGIRNGQTVCRFPRGYYSLDKLKEHLESSGFSVRTGPVQLSAGLTYLEVVMASAGSFGALSAVIATYLRRHRDKEAHIVINGEPIILKGYSEQEVERISTMLHNKANEKQELN